MFSWAVYGQTKYLNDIAMIVIEKGWKILNLDCDLILYPSNNWGQFLGLLEVPYSKIVSQWTTLQGINKIWLKLGWVSRIPLETHPRLRILDIKF